jgi:hypothetical protein
MELSTSLANVIFGLHLTMKSFFCGVVNFTILTEKDLPHFILASSSRSYFLHVVDVAEVEKVMLCFLHHPEVLLDLSSPASGNMGELVHQDPSIAALGRC